MRVHADLACCLAPPSGPPGAAMLEAPSSSPPSPPPPLPPPESPPHARQLLLQLNAQRTKGFLCDVVVVVQNALFRAHKNVLAASSAYLKALVVHDNLVNLDQEMVSPPVFRAVLDFIYTGRLGGTDSHEGPPSEEPSLGAILAAASYLQIPDLVALCKKKLKRSGKYFPLRGNGNGGGIYSPLGKLARGLRAATPVIQSCFGRPGDGGNPLSTHCAELYAASQAGLLCAPLCGLDLSKKSPNGQLGPPLPPVPPSSQARLRSTIEAPPNPPLHEEPPQVPQPPFHHHPPPHPLLHHPHIGTEAAILEPSNRPELGPDFIYRWMKHEPLSYVEEEEEEGQRRTKEGEKEASPSPTRPFVDGERNSVTAENEKSSSEMEEEEEDDEEEESAGSSGGGPSPSLERFLGYGDSAEGFGGDNLYVCIPCGKGFPSSEELNAHVEAHNEEEEALEKSVPAPAPPMSAPPSAPADLLRPYRCNSCEKAYKDPATLRQHEKTHWLTRPYPCSICGKKFTQRGTMTRHMRSHLGLKPFACEACGMRFTRQYRLTEHMRIHSGEKPYECRVCGGKFAQQRNLLSHMKMHAAAAAAAAAQSVTPEALRLGFSPEGPHHPLLADPKTALQGLYLGLGPDKAAQILAQSAALSQMNHEGSLSGPRGLERFSPP
ncbi:hypermethylated in cancer 1 protein isoform X1 [Anolis sagrei]|uniref:hypermethylated in cancer 1 protein isoform X1 n=2 Tax=Anolis sagrei TaxID=38937 RepID=UPI00352077DE